jgi:hypothetical protein
MDEVSQHRGGRKDGEIHFIECLQQISVQIH